VKEGPLIRGQVSADRQLQKIDVQRKARFEISKVRSSELRRRSQSVDLRGTDMVHRFERHRSEPSVQTVPSRKGDRRSRNIVGTGSVRTLKH
jgi:hypothetical protein